MFLGDDDVFAIKGFHSPLFHFFFFALQKKSVGNIVTIVQVAHSLPLWKHAVSLQEKSKESVAWSNLEAQRLSEKKTENKCFTSFDKTRY